MPVAWIYTFCNLARPFSVLHVILILVGPACRSSPNTIFFTCAHYFFTCEERSTERTAVPTSVVLDLKPFRPLRQLTPEPNLSEQLKTRRPDVASPRLPATHPLQPRLWQHRAPHGVIPSKPPPTSWCRNSTTERCALQSSRQLTLQRGFLSSKIRQHVAKDDLQEDLPTGSFARLQVPAGGATEKKTYNRINGSYTKGRCCKSLLSPWKVGVSWCTMG